MSNSETIDHETISMSINARRAMNTFADGMQVRRGVAENDHQRSMRQRLIEENIELADANKKLKDQVDEGNDLIAYWANGNEAFRRTLKHLSESWAPKPGSEADVHKILAENKDGIQGDVNWEVKRNEISDTLRVKSRATRKKRARP